MPTKIANFRRLKCVRGGSQQGSPLLVAPDQHGPRFVFLLNSEKGPAELSKVRVLVSFHPP